MHYAPGERFARHHDFFDPKHPGFSGELAKSGQRVSTFLIYLNRNFLGGETEFPRLRLNHKGEPGDGLMWSNLDPTGAPEYRTVHAGLPPIVGEKWLFCNGSESAKQSNRQHWSGGVRANLRRSRKRTRWVAGRAD